MSLLLPLLLWFSAARAACPDVRDCQQRASTWEDAAWFGVGIGWTGFGTATALYALDADVPEFAAPMALGGFGLSVPLMAAASHPSRRAVELSGNPLTLELRRRPRYWTMYAAGMAAGGTAVALVMTDTGPWWVPAGIGIGGAAVLTGAAGGFARDARWIRRQAPIHSGRPRLSDVRLVPTPSGARLVGAW